MQFEACVQFGATTLSITTFTITINEIRNTQHNGTRYREVAVLSVIYAECHAACHKQAHYAECHYAECRYVERRIAKPLLYHVYYHNQLNLYVPMFKKIIVAPAQNKLECFNNFVILADKEEPTNFNVGSYLHFL